MNETQLARQSLYSILNGDDTLMAGVPGGVHYQQIPQVGEFPAVVYQLQSSADSNVLGARAATGQIWQVRITAKGDSAAATGVLLARIDTLLQDATDTQAGAKLMWRRQGATDYTETDNGIRYIHQALLFRCWIS